jgi:hypothetical protein
MFSSSFKILLFFSLFFQKLLDIWPILSQQNFSCFPSFQFHPMQQLWDGDFSLHSTKAKAAREHIITLQKFPVTR